jgi:hypothetical protein
VDSEKRDLNSEGERGRSDMYGIALMVRQIGSSSVVKRKSWWERCRLSLNLVAAVSAVNLIRRIAEAYRM